MPDYVHLIGSETIGNAGHQMQQAADQIQQSMRWFDETAQRLIRSLDRLSETMEEATRKPEKDDGR